MRILILSGLLLLSSACGPMARADLCDGYEEAEETTDTNDIAPFEMEIGVAEEIEEKEEEPVSKFADAPPEVIGWCWVACSQIFETAPCKIVRYRNSWECTCEGQTWECQVND